MRQGSDRFLGIQMRLASTLMFWPLIALGARLVGRVVFNLWDMLEQ